MEKASGAHLRSSVILSARDSPTHHRQGEGQLSFWGKDNSHAVGAWRELKVQVKINSSLLLKGKGDSLSVPGGYERSRLDIDLKNIG